MKKNNNKDSKRVSRRKMVGDSVITLAGLYAAPATLSLLTASRATAQSAPPEPPAPAVTVTVFNQTGAVLTVNFTSPAGADNRVIAIGGNVQFEVLCPSVLTFSNGQQVNQTCNGMNVWVIS